VICWGVELDQIYTLLLTWISCKSCWWNKDLLQDSLVCTEQVSCNCNSVSYNCQCLMVINRENTLIFPMWQIIFISSH